ncbi:hypothetical protein H8356DRAFT_1418214 [Neocallimastix lanati (nom. inval.)]|nr:hypothetical protein H8356DRAFT_1418214 [Neocallimastix sp. JGI-2020a]
MQYNIDIFADGTFKIAPKCGYQVFITRTYVKELNSFYTTSFSTLKNKEQRTYEVLFYEIKKNAEMNNNIIITPKQIFIVILKKVFLMLLKNEYLEHKYDNFLEFLEYFKITYLKDYEIKHWNYYDNIEHITNNVSEQLFKQFISK